MKTRIHKATFYVAIVGVIVGWSVLVASPLDADFALACFGIGAACAIVSISTEPPLATPERRTR